MIFFRIPNSPPLPPAAGLNGWGNREAPSCLDERKIFNWLVDVGGIPTPLKHMKVQVGRMTSHILWKTKTCLKPPTSYSCAAFFFSDCWDTNFRETLPVAPMADLDTRQKNLWRSWAFKGCGASPLSRTVCSSHGGVVKSTSNDHHHHHHVFLVRGMLVFILGIHQRFNTLLNMDQISRSGSCLDTSTRESKCGKAAPILTLSSKNVCATEHGIWVMAIPQWYNGKPYVGDYDSNSCQL